MGTWTYVNAFPIAGEEATIYVPFPCVCLRPGLSYRFAAAAENRSAAAPAYVHCGWPYFSKDCSTPNSTLYSTYREI
jgi:hypothetical protein